MAFTYDLTTDEGKVRLLITDTNETYALFADEEIEAFLDLEGDNVKRAAATALDQIASNESLIQKRITLLDLSTDGPAVAKALREHATLLRKQADDAEMDAELAEDGGMFDIAEMTVDVFSMRERLINDALRGL